MNRYRAIKLFTAPGQQRKAYGLSDSFAMKTVEEFDTIQEATAEAERQNNAVVLPTSTPFRADDQTARRVNRVIRHAITPAMATAAAASGGVQVLEPGTYNYDSVTVNNGSVFKARVPRSVTIVSPNSKYAFHQAAGTKVDFEDILFDGSVLAPNGKCTFNFTGCGFTNFGRGPDTGFGRGVAIGLPYSCEPRDSHVRNCYFHDDLNGWCLGWFRGDGDPNDANGVCGLEVSDTTFFNVLNALKANNVGNTAYNDRTLRCLARKIRRMFHEKQGCTGGERFNDNVQDQTILSGNFHENDSVLGASLITHGKNNGSQWNEALRNTFRIAEAPDGTGQRLAFEVGNLWRVNRNYIIGSKRNTAFAWFLGDSNPDNNGWVQSHPEHFVADYSGNRLIDINLGGGEGGPWDRQADTSNNGPNTPLDWDINRKDPGHNWSGAPVPPNPNPEPPVDSPDNTYITAGGKLVTGGKTVTINSGHVAIDGLQDAHTNGVKGVLLYGGFIYQDQGVPTWWKATAAPPTVPMQYVATTDPRVVVPPIDPPPDPVTTVTRLACAAGTGSLNIDVTTTNGKPVKLELK